MKVVPTTKLIFSTLIRLPEMRTFWFFVPFLLLGVAVDFVALPLGQAAVSAALLIFIGIVLFVATIRSARINFETSIESTELRNIVFNLEDAIVLYDQNLTFLFFSPAAERLFNLKSKQVVGKTFTPQDVEDPSLKRLVQVIYPSLAPVVISRTKAGLYPQVADISFDEPKLDLRVTTVPLAAGRGVSLHFMKIIRDRTRELFLIKSKSEFVTVASHQLRSPATDILWALEALGAEGYVADPAKEILGKARESANRLVHVIEDILDVQKIEEGRFSYQFKSVETVKFVDAVLSSVLEDARRAGIKLYFDRPKASLPQVMIDEQKLSFVLRNIIENAVRYNVKNGEVVVSIDRVRDEPFLAVHVKDTGIGIPAEDIPKIFSKFFRAENALKFETEGSGLGLYIAKNIIQAHGGRLWLDSEVGRGSTFHFTLSTDPNLVPKHEVALEE